nr:hypothetical protein [Novosphingobium sp.]
MTVPTSWAGIGEADARDDIAEIYADIRATSGLPAINLVYRNMAAIPGALSHVWHVLRPLYASGAVHDFDREIRQHVPLPNLPPVFPYAVEAARLTETDRREIADILNFYTAANAMNLLALSVLLGAFDEGNGASNSSLRHLASRSQERLNPIRPLPPMDALTHHHRQDWDRAVEGTRASGPAVTPPKNIGFADGIDAQVPKGCGQAFQDAGSVALAGRGLPMSGIVGPEARGIIGEQHSAAALGLCLRCAGQPVKRSLSELCACQSSRLLRAHFRRSAEGYSLLLAALAELDEPALRAAGKHPQAEPRHLGIPPEELLPDNLAAGDVPIEPDLLACTLAPSPPSRSSVPDRL